MVTPVRIRIAASSAALVFAVLLAADAVAASRSSGVSSSRSMSGFSSGSRSSSSFSAPSRSAGSLSWGSSASKAAPAPAPAKPIVSAPPPVPVKQSGFASSTAAKAVAVTAMGSALYAASSNKAAADTYAQSAKPQVPSASPSSGAPAGNTSSSRTVTAPSVHSVPAYTAPAATHTTVVHNNGNDGLLLGYMLGSAGRSGDRPVVINNGGQQGAAPQVGYVAPVGQMGMPYTAPGEAVQPQALAPRGLVEQGESHWFRNLMIVLFLGGAGFGLYRLWSLRAARIAAATPVRNYSL